MTALALPTPDDVMAPTATARALDMGYFVATVVLILSLDTRVAVLLVDSLGSLPALFVAFGIWLFLTALRVMDRLLEAGLDFLSIVLGLLAAAALCVLFLVVSPKLAGGEPGVRQAVLAAPQLARRPAGWGYLIAAHGHARHRHRLEKAGVVLTDGQWRRLLPTARQASPAQAMAAVLDLSRAPPLVGQQAERFVLAARLTGHLGVDQSQPILARRLVFAAERARARAWAQAHVPSSSDPVLIQQAWLALAGERPWSQPFSTQAPYGQEGK